MQSERFVHAVRFEHVRLRIEEQTALRFVHNQIVGIDNRFEQHRQQVVKEVCARKHAQVFYFLDAAVAYPRFACKHYFGNDHIEDLTDVRVAVRLIRRRACVAAAAEFHAEFCKQVKQIDLYARTADALQIDKHYAVFEINAEFGGAFRFIVEGDADVRFQSFENCRDVEIKVVEIDLGQVFHAQLLQIQPCFYVEFEAVVHLV